VVAVAVGGYEVPVCVAAPPWYSTLKWMTAWVMGSRWDAPAARAGLVTEGERKARLELHELVVRSRA
jgi:hypothetical protein